MKNSIKKLFLSLFVASVFSPVFSFDFGGALTENFKLKNPAAQNDLKADIDSRLVLWERYPFDNLGTSYITIQGSLDFDKNFALSGTDGMSFVTDLDILKYQMSKETDAGKLTFSFGRFNNADLTGMILSQNLDGAKAQFETGFLSVSANLGYTGLLNSLSVSILNEQYSAYSGDSFFYALCENYLEGGLNLTLPALIPGHAIVLEALDAIKFDNTSFNRLYFTVGMNGTVIPSVYYDFATVLEVLSKKDTDVLAANLTTANLYYYFGLGSATLNVTYASGNNGTLKPFLGITSQTAVNSYRSNTEYTGLVKTGLSGSYKFIDTLLVTVSADVIFDALDTFSYAGFQYGLNANYQLFSDLGFGAGLNQYLDGSNPENNKINIEVKASVSF